MNQAKTSFVNLVNKNHITASVYDYLAHNHIPLDYSDLLRWQWILTVAALDKYIHDIVLIGMLETFVGKREATAKYKNFSMTLDTMLSIQNSETPIIEFEKVVVHKHSYLSFQDPEKIAEALSHFWNETNKWDVICSNMNSKPSVGEVKTKLKNIIIRRNQIAHEGDCISNTPLLQQDIKQEDIEDVIIFIKEIVDAIDKSIVKV